MTKKIKFVSFASPVAAINELKLYPLPTSKAIAGTVFPTEQHTIIRAHKANKEERLYYIGYFNPNMEHAYPLGHYGWLDSILAGLVELKVLTKRDLEAHSAAVIHNEYDAVKLQWASCFLRHINLLRLELSPEQKALMVKMGSLPAEESDDAPKPEDAPATDDAPATEEGGEIATAQGL